MIKLQYEKHLKYWNDKFVKMIEQVFYDSRNHQVSMNREKLFSYYKELFSYFQPIICLWVLLKLYFSLLISSISSHKFDPCRCIFKKKNHLNKNIERELCLKKEEKNRNKDVSGCRKKKECTSFSEIFLRRRCVPI